MRIPAARHNNHRRMIPRPRCRIDKHSRHIPVAIPERTRCSIRPQHNRLRKSSRRLCHSSGRCHRSRGCRGHRRAPHAGARKNTSCRQQKKLSHRAASIHSFGPNPAVKNVTKDEEFAEPTQPPIVIP
jgi:hypothetical protein